MQPRSALPSVLASLDAFAAVNDLTLLADSLFVQAKTWRINRMMPREVIRVADRDVALNVTLRHNVGIAPWSGIDAFLHIRSFAGTNGGLFGWSMLSARLLVNPRG